MGGTSSWAQCSDVFWLRAGLSVCVGVAPLQYQWAVGCCFFCLCTFLLFICFSFPSSPFDSPSLTVAFLQGVAQDFMLSCNHRLTLSLFPGISMSLKSPAATLQPLPLPVSLSRGSASLLYFCWRCLIHLFLHFFSFLGGRSFALPYSFDLHSFFFLVVRHATLPSARHALYHGSVLRLFTVL